MSRGFILGKFLPPHTGHMFLCHTAAQMVDDLTILVCSLNREPIPGNLRRDWMAALNPNARICWINKDVPQTPSEHPDFWNIWQKICQEHHPEPIDRVFGSEDYILRLAEELGAKPVIVDPDREAVPVSGTTIRKDPAAHWSFIPGPVRPFYQKRVVLFGPESTGKSTLSKYLADHFNTLWVPEYGRTYDTYCKPKAWKEDDFEAIAQGHLASRKALAPIAGPVLLEDTDPLLTCVWQEMLIGHQPKWSQEVDLADLYLLMDIDMPWVDDGLRYFGSKEKRQLFMDLATQILDDRGAHYVRISGDWESRQYRAIEAIESLLQGRAARHERKT